MVFWFFGFLVLGFGHGRCQTNIHQRINDEHAFHVCLNGRAHNIVGVRERPEHQQQTTSNTANNVPAGSRIPVFFFEHRGVFWSQNTKVQPFKTPFQYGMCSGTSETHKYESKQHSKRCSRTHGSVSTSCSRRFADRTLLPVSTLLVDQEADPEPIPTNKNQKTKKPIFAEPWSRH